MRRKSDKTKEYLRMGTGTGANYKSYIQVGEFGSRGISSCIVDYKVHRTVHLLSQVEVMAWYLLRWDDDNLDIREQYPLPKEDTLKIADNYGLPHPYSCNGPRTMTTDLLITRKEGLFAVSVKATSSGLSDSNITNLFIEQQYWLSQGVPWKLITKDQMNDKLYRNIRNVVAHYNDTYFPDEISFLKFLIARKLIEVDMEKEIDYEELLIKKRKELEIWKSEELKLVTNI